MTSVTPFGPCAGARLHGHRRADSRARHRREHRDLQSRERRAAAAAAVRGARSPRRALGRFTSGGGPERISPTAATYVEWSRAARSFEDIALFDPATYNLTRDGEPERLAACPRLRTCSTCSGLQPLLGRTFAPDDEGPAAMPVVVVSEGLWADASARIRSSSAATIVVDGLRRTRHRHRASGLRVPVPDTSIWLPAAYTPERAREPLPCTHTSSRGSRPACRYAAAQAEMDALALNLTERAAALSNSRSRVLAWSICKSTSRARRGRRCSCCSAAVGAVLADHLRERRESVARARRQRQKELAIRKALGARAGPRAAAAVDRERRARRGWRRARRRALDALVRLSRRA